MIFLETLGIFNILRSWTPSGCDWSESHPLWIFSSTKLWRPWSVFFFQLQLFSTWDGRVGVFGRNCTMYIPWIGWKLNINRLRYSQIDFLIWRFLEFLKHTEVVPCCEQLLQRNVSLLRLKMFLYVTWVMNIQTIMSTPLYNSIAYIRHIFYFQQTQSMSTYYKNVSAKDWGVPEAIVCHFFPFFFIFFSFFYHFFIICFSQWTYIKILKKPWEIVKKIINFHFILSAD